MGLQADVTLEPVRKINGERKIWNSPPMAGFAIFTL
jgi:hypothetical protein